MAEGKVESPTAKGNKGDKEKGTIRPQSQFQSPAYTGSSKALKSGYKGD